MKQSVDDAAIHTVSRRVRWRLGICAAAFFIGLMLAAIPIPYVSQLSLTQVILELVGRSSPVSCSFGGCGDGYRLYFFVSALSAFFLMQPVPVYQALAQIGPPDLGNRKRARAVATASLCVPIVCGVFFADSLLVPLYISWITRWDPASVAPIQMWAYSEYMWTTTSLYFLIGLAFQLPLWPSVLTQLRIARFRTLARCRRFVLLAAVILGALVTPTTDLTTMAMLAVPLYLLYELGLLIARFTPPPFRAGEGVGG